MKAKPGPEPRRSSGDSLCDILEDSERFMKKRMRRKFPLVVVFVACMVLLVSAILVSIGWTTVPRGVVMALMLFIGLIGVIAYKTYVSRNSEYTLGFRIAYSFILMAGFLVPQWGTDKFANLLVGALAATVGVEISQRASRLLKKDRRSRNER